MKPGDVISYLEMCQAEGVNLQRGMNFHLGRDASVVLMSLRLNAPYADRVEEEGRILIYEGHDVSRTIDTPVPKTLDQPMRNPSGKLTQNGLFYNAAKRIGKELRNTERVRVYEKLHRGIWVYNGTFSLIDAWREQTDTRVVFKFKLRLEEDTEVENLNRQSAKTLEHSRIIPSSVKLEVWRRDNGKCVKCDSEDNLHFDHIIPFSKGGSSLVAENIQLLCARHNIAKRDSIQ